MSAEESNKAIMRRFWDVWEQGNIDLLDELLAPDYVNHTLATPDLPPGPEGDKVATRYALEGTHRGELFGIPPTGQRLSIKSITVERVSEGKIVEHWRNTDELGMMRQLGVFGAQGEQPSGSLSSARQEPSS